MGQQDILVTGGAGYIGSHTCKSLSRHGFRPITFDNLSRGFRRAVRWGPFEKGDLFDSDRLVEVIRYYQPSAVLHFAAFAYVGESMEHPDLYYKNNIGGTLSLLTAMRKTGLKNIVFSSSCSVYGEVPNERIHEGINTAPISTYGYSKLVVERMLADHTRAYGFLTTSLRYFNAAGADPEGEIGEDHQPEPHIVPNLLMAAAGRREPVTIYGSDYDTKDGTCVRDFVHVSDLADAHVLALLALSEGRARPVYNLGNGNGFSLLEIIRAAEHITNRRVPYHIGPRRPGDPARAVADASLAIKELGWRPERPSIDGMLESAWQWMQKNGS